MTFFSLFLNDRIHFNKINKIWPSISLVHWNTETRMKIAYSNHKAGDEIMGKFINSYIILTLLSTSNLVLNIYARNTLRSKYKKCKLFYIMCVPNCAPHFAIATVQYGTKHNVIIKRIWLILWFYPSAGFHVVLSTLLIFIWLVWFWIFFDKY